MRTNQQLGYIVWGGAASFKTSSYFYFIIQSGDHPAEYLADQAERFTITLPDSLQQLPDDEFLIIKNAVSRANLKPPFFIVNFSHPGIALRGIGEHGKKIYSG